MRQRFLVSRLMEDWLDLIGAFETTFRVKGRQKGNRRGCDGTPALILLKTIVQGR